MRMFSAEYMNKTAVEEIKKIDGVYYSKSEDSFCVTDQMMEHLTEKYNITTNEDFAEPEYQDKYNFVEHIYTGIEQWIEWHYDGDEVEYFGKSFYSSDYAECVKLDYEDWDSGDFSFPDGADWSEEIEKTLKREVSIGIKIKLEEELCRAVDEGYNLHELEDAFTSAKLRLEYIQKQTA